MWRNPSTSLDSPRFTKSWREKCPMHEWQGWVADQLDSVFYGLLPPMCLVKRIVDPVIHDVAVDQQNTWEIRRSATIPTTAPTIGDINTFCQSRTRSRPSTTKANPKGRPGWRRRRSTVLVAIPRGVYLSVRSLPVRYLHSAGWCTPRKGVRLQVSSRNRSAHKPGCQGEGPTEVRIAHLMRQEPPKFSGRAVPAVPAAPHPFSGTRPGRSRRVSQEECPR